MGESWHNHPAQFHGMRCWMHPSSASPRPLREVFPILLLQAGLTLSGQLAGLEMPLDLGAHVLLHRERRGRGWLCPEPRAAVPSLSPCPHRTAWPSWASTGMRRSSSSSCRSPDHRGTGIQLAAWGGQGEGWIPHSHGAPGDWDTQIPLWSPTWAGKPCRVWSRATVLARSLPRRVRSFQ